MTTTHETIIVTQTDGLQGPQGPQGIPGTVAAPLAEYVVLATDAALTNERVLRPDGTTITMVDGGAKQHLDLKAYGEWGAPVASAANVNRTPGTFAIIVDYDLTIYPANTTLIVRFKAYARNANGILAQSQRTAITNQGGTWRELTPLNTILDWYNRDSGLGSGTFMQFDVGVSTPGHLGLIALTASAASVTVVWDAQLFAIQPMS